MMGWSDCNAGAARQLTSSRVGPSRAGRPRPPCCGTAPCSSTTSVRGSPASGIQTVTARLPCPATGSSYSAIPGVRLTALRSTTAPLTPPVTCKSAPCGTGLGGTAQLVEPSSSAAASAATLRRARRTGQRQWRNEGADGSTRATGCSSAPDFAKRQFTARALNSRAPLKAVVSRASLGDEAAGGNAARQPDITTNGSALADGDAAKEGGARIDDHVVLNHRVPGQAFDQLTIALRRKSARAQGHP